MAKKRKKTKKTTEKPPQSSKYFFGAILMLFVMFSVVMILWFRKDKIMFYYAHYFNNTPHKILTNTAFETERIHKITEHYAGKTFGMDISHYQNKSEILWDSLTIANESISLDFVVLRATMGNDAKDNHFEEFWEKAGQHGLIRGAYHFYRPDEDPVLQAQSYIRTVKLEKGDLLPVLDIEKMPRRKSKEQYLKDVQTWLDIVEKAYGKKPIIYTFYYFYKDNLRGKFDDYPLWLANYNDVLVPSEEDKWEIWQFTENGISAGAKVKIDLNVFNGSKREMQELLLD